MKKSPEKKKKSKQLTQAVIQRTPVPKQPFSFKQVWALSEFWSFLLAVSAALLVAAILLVGFQFDRKIGKALMRILTSHLIMGAPMGALEGAKFPSLHFGLNVFFNSLITVAIICFFNTLFSLSCKKLFHIPILHSTFKDIQGDAQRQKKTWARYGIPGIFTFVFIPMPMTGPVVGSLLARFVGLGYWGAITTVIFASISSICAWGYAADILEKYLGGRILNIILWSLIGVTVAIAAYAKIRVWQNRRREKRVEKEQEQDDGRYFFNAVNDDASKTYHHFPTDY